LFFGRDPAAPPLSANRREANARARELLVIVGLAADAANRYAHEFSGGPRQRIGLARALSVNPGFRS
jgi:peptide/nickel transport system ATP-binding protein